MDTARIEIDAPADLAYDLVADITNMGRWSPETYRTTWVGEPAAPVPGARFKGWNRATVYGVPTRWATTCTIRRADRGRAFSFDTPFSGARWTYLFEPGATHGTCTVTETREEVATPLVTRALYLAVGGVRRRQLAAGMHETLHRLKEAAEAEAATTGNDVQG
ncbi:MAG: SRPBCC family protein [Acidimicrobiales bacterium]